MTLTAVVVHCLQKDIVNCLNDKPSQPGTYAEVLDKHVQARNCDTNSATSDNYNLGVNIIGIPENESLKVKEPFFPSR